MHQLLQMWLPQIAFTCILVSSTMLTAQTETNAKMPEEPVTAPKADLAMIGFESTPKEIGFVAWTRDWEAAQKISGETGRPLFVLFQEVPG